MCHEITNPETVVIDHADVLIPLFSAPGRQPDLRIQCLFFTGERLHAGKFLIIRRFGNIIPHFLSRCIQYHLLLYCRRNPLSPCHLGRHTPHPQHPYSTFPLPAWPRFPSSYRSPSLPVYPSTLCRAGFCRRSGLPDPRPEYREFQRIDTISSHPYRP